MASKWQVDGMFAGFVGLGTEDAWYETALEIERHRLNNTPHSGSATDIWKCFDQINRPLLYRIATTAGLPHFFVDAYARFQEQLLIHNALATGLGEAHSRRS